MTSCSLPASSRDIIPVTVWDWAPYLTLVQELSGRGGGSGLCSPALAITPSLQFLTSSPANLPGWARNGLLQKISSCTRLPQALPASLKEAGILWEALL